MSASIETGLESAFRAVCRAATISRGIQERIDIARLDKDDKSPVTVADLAVQSFLSGVLLGISPDVPLMGEEGGGEVRSPEYAPLMSHVAEAVGAARKEAVSIEQATQWIERGHHTINPDERYWVLDPVDGTKGFLRKGQYAIALALIERGVILGGVLACPNLPGLFGEDDPSAGFVFVAAKGRGARMARIDRNGEPDSLESVRVSDTADPELGRWCERIESSNSNQDHSARIVEAAGLRHEPIRLDSQAKYAVVARGEVDIYLRHTLDPTYRECVWDHAAGAIVVEEAGGRVTDLRGERLDVTAGRRLTRNRGVLATNGRLHEPMLAAIRDILGPVTV